MGRYPANKEPHVNVATIIPASVHLQLKAIAEAEDRTVAAVIRRMIVQVVQSYNAQS